MAEPTDPHPLGAPVPATQIPPAAVERAVQVLTHHFAHDEITEEDFEARLERVYAATSLAALGQVVADLPIVAPGGASSPMRPQGPPPERIMAVLSGQERKVTGVVARELSVRARLGYVELDLTEAAFEPGITTIDVRPFMGYVQIRLPSGLRVESAGRALFGFFAVNGAHTREAEASATVVRLTGRAVFGYAECHVAAPRRLKPGAE
jgi:hypothetical protein